jgi:hypothetical protein
MFFVFQYKKCKLPTVQCSYSCFTAEHSSYLSTSMLFFSLKKKFILYLVQRGKENDTTGVWCVCVIESLSLNSITEIMLTARKWKPSVEVLENFRSIGLYIKK